MAAADTGPVRVLHVDDDPLVLNLSESVFATVGDFDVTGATEIESALTVLEEADIDCIVSDYDMPTMDGLNFLRVVREHDPALPFILFTGRGSEEVASEAISAGVTDYLQKGGKEQYEVLANRVNTLAEKRRTERILERTERRYQTLVEQSLVGIYLILDGHFEYVNPGLASIFGYEVKDLLGREVATLVHPDDRELVAENLERRRLGEVESIRYALRGVKQDGAIIEVESHGRRVEFGDSVAVMGVLVELTERRQSAVEADVKYRTVVETAPDAFVFIDLETERITEANPAAERLFGRSACDLVGRHFTELQPPDQYEHVRRQFDRRKLGTAPDHPMPSENNFAYTADGERIPVDVQAHVVDLPDGSVMLATFHDMREYHRMEAALRQSEREHRDVLADIRDVVFRTDREGNWTYLNPAWEALTGRSVEASLGTPFVEVIHPDDREIVTQAFEDALAGKSKSSVLDVFRVLTTDGAIGWLEVASRRIYDSDGTVSGLTGSFRDVTARYEHEARLERQNDRLEAVADIVSHDLRSPLNVVAGAVDLALTDGDDSMLPTAAAACGRMDHILADLIRATRADVGETGEQVLLSTVVWQAWDRIETDEATLTVVDDGDLDADPGLLVQLFVNLFQNAVAHGDRTVAVEVGVVDGGFYVSDDGPGIPEPERERVFERGFTTREQGSGVGLSVVGSIAAAHDWTPRVCEGRAGGARFEFVPTGDAS